jgi:hypothetical protein
MSVILGKAIYYLLSTNSAITAAVNDIDGKPKIFPIAADDDVKNPFVVFERKSVKPEYSRDGKVLDVCTVEVNVCDDNYTSCIDIANSVRTALELKRGTFAGVNIFSSHLINASENYGVDNFLQTLTFEIKTT